MEKSRNRRKTRKEGRKRRDGKKEVEEKKGEEIIETRRGAKGLKRNEGPHASFFPVTHLCLPSNSSFASRLVLRFLRPCDFRARNQPAAPSKRPDEFSRLEARNFAPNSARGKSLLVAEVAESSGLKPGCRDLEKGRLRDLRHLLRGRGHSIWSSCRKETVVHSPPPAGMIRRQATRCEADTSATIPSSYCFHFNEKRKPKGGATDY